MQNRILHLTGQLDVESDSASFPAIVRFLLSTPFWSLGAGCWFAFCKVSRHVRSVQLDVESGSANFPAIVRFCWCTSLARTYLRAMRSRFASLFTRLCLSEISAFFFFRNRSLEKPEPRTNCNPYRTGDSETMHRFEFFEISLSPRIHRCASQFARERPGTSKPSNSIAATFQFWSSRNATENFVMTQWIALFFLAVGTWPEKTKKANKQRHNKHDNKRSQTENLKPMRPTTPNQLKQRNFTIPKKNTKALTKDQGNATPSLHSNTCRSSCCPEAKGFPRETDPTGTNLELFWTELKTQAAEFQMPPNKNSTFASANFPRQKGNPAENKPTRKEQLDEPGQKRKMMQLKFRFHPRNSFFLNHLAPPK